MNTFKYVGATLTDNDDMDAEMTHRIQSGWKNWKRVSGILCDRRISLRVKGKVYKTVVRPAMMYGAETWAVRLKWYGHVLRIEDKYVLRRQESDGDGGAEEKKERKTKAGVVG